ncbi:hypothetical protein OPQ81_002957 [Rhizoctonia solani]|nr:hypothetical protein OPQ81_002957 [Rhizoctonia solani]
MHLMYTLDEEGKRVYTLKKVTPGGKITKSAHPARFSPDDKFARHRVTIKKRMGNLPVDFLYSQFFAVHLFELSMSMDQFTDTAPLYD